MARIIGETEQLVASIRTFLGLNENPDGETALKDGEFARMWNFRITKDGHLQKRPGCKRVMSVYAASGTAGGAGNAGNGGDDGQAELFAAIMGGEDKPEIPATPEEDGMEVHGPIDPNDPNYPDPNAFPKDPVTGLDMHLLGVWHGTVGGKDRVLANYDGYILELDLAKPGAKVRGRAATEKTRFFGFGDRVYFLDGEHYKVWDGEKESQFGDVMGYVPLVQTATTPGGSGTRLEAVNRLNGWRRVRFSPDGTSKVFTLPERDVDSVAGVALNGTSISSDSYTVRLAEGTVTLQTAPAEGTNTLEVTYVKGEGARSEVTRMRCAELFNGATDTRVFLYGDGSNRAIYSGVEYESGAPSAEYFPDLFEVAVGEQNTPLTALVRHYSRLMAYKPGSAWVVTAGDITTQSGRLVPAFYVAPVNRQIGNRALGEVQLLENDPITFDVGGVYQWKNANGYISNSENNARRISDRVTATLRGFDVAKIRTLNMKRDYEFWVLHGSEALIYNYGNDTWYFYRELPFHDLLDVNGKLYGFSNNGDVVEVDPACRDDCGTAINCYAETGAMDFGRDWQLKYSPMLFVAIRPEVHARVYVTVESDRRVGYPDKLVSGNLSTFDKVDFRHFSFVTNRGSKARRLRLKVKKAALYKIIYKCTDKNATATVIETDVRLRYGGYVKK